MFSHIQNAVQSLRSNHTRSLLTMLGVTIGIASITTILALGSGASQIVDQQVEALGGNIAVIRPSNTAKSGDLSDLHTNNDFAASTLTETDIISIQNAQNVKAVAPLMVLSGTVKADSGAPAGTPILATTPDFGQIERLETGSGQFINDAVAINTATIGAQLSVDLFGTEQSIGKTFTIRGQTFTVIGVLKRLGSPINYNSIDLDRTAIISLEGGRQLNRGILQIQQINIQSDSVANLDQTLADINQELLKNHAGEQDFTILSGSQIAQPTSRLFYAIANVTTAIAAISLIVGGVGIMNIMLVSVAERTREIGIRKALGATNADIAWQFLIESLAISLGGGLIGYVVGYVIAFALSTFLTFNPIFNWQIMLTVAAVSIIIGTLFGFYPAVRAARKDPIEALRQYD